VGFERFWPCPPSLLAHDIQQGIKQFLITGFEPADGFFHGVMRRFVENEAAWMNGPYLQIGLPFRHDRVGRDFFNAFQTDHPAYTHQCQAWQRPASDRLAAHTLVATGIGIGKTECFVYPAADHCTRARQTGESGIKALVICPMNALATEPGSAGAVRRCACMPESSGRGHMSREGCSNCVAPVALCSTTGGTARPAAMTNWWRSFVPPARAVAPVATSP
jgi:hypothetical protein